MIGRACSTSPASAHVSAARATATAPPSRARMQPKISFTEDRKAIARPWLRLPPVNTDALCALEVQQRCHNVGGRHVHNPTHPHHNRPIRDRNRPPGLEKGVRATHDPTKGLHFGKAPPLPRGARTHLLFRMGI